MGNFSPAAITATGQYCYTGEWDHFTVYDCSAATPVPQQNGSPAVGDFVLHGNYPNPFNAATMLRYSVPRASEVELSVFDVLGRRVAVLTSGVQSVGEHELLWDASRFSSGIYFARLSAGSSVQSVKMILLK